MPVRSAAEIYGELVDRLLAAAGADPRVKALWLEGDSPADLRRPYRMLEVHLAADEPDFAPVVAGIESLVGGGGPVADAQWADVPRFARELRCTLDGAPVTVIVEKSSLLAKRPRAAVAALADRTGHLYHVLDFSKSRGP
jgi:hypothetical protein